MKEYRVILEYVVAAESATDAAKQLRHVLDKGDRDFYVDVYDDEEYDGINDHNQESYEQVHLEAQ